MCFSNTLNSLVGLIDEIFVCGKRTKSVCIYPLRTKKKEIACGIVGTSVDVFIGKGSYVKTGSEGKTTNQGFQSGCNVFDVFGGKNVNMSYGHVY